MSVSTMWVLSQKGVLRRQTHQQLLVCYAINDSDSDCEFMFYTRACLWWVLEQFSLPPSLRLWSSCFCTSTLYLKWIVVVHAMAMSFLVRAKIHFDLLPFRTVLHFAVRQQYGICCGVCNKTQVALDALIIAWRLCRWSIYNSIMWK